MVFTVNLSDVESKYRNTKSRAAVVLSDPGIYHEYYKIERIEDGEFPTLSDDRLYESPSLRQIISSVLEKSRLRYIDAQQFFNTLCKKKVEDSILASEPKESKWKKRN